MLELKREMKGIIYNIEPWGILLDLRTTDDSDAFADAD